MRLETSAALVWTACMGLAAGGGEAFTPMWLPQKNPGLHQPLVRDPQ